MNGRLARTFQTAAGAGLALALLAGPVAAQPDPLDVLGEKAGVPQAGQGQGGQGQAPQNLGWERLESGWEQFGDLPFILDMAIVLIFSMLLASLIAYHPLTRAKASSMTEIEQPKTFIMYSMVGAVIALLVLAVPEMAFVVFGIGGLLRFRTDVGEAKDTGRVILVTVVGLCCGLKLYVIAVLATAFGWVVIYYLESQAAGRMLVKGLGREAIPRAQEEYEKILEEAGCGILGRKKNIQKGQVTFVFKAPADLDRDALEQRFSELPQELQGVVDWEIA